MRQAKKLGLLGLAVALVAVFGTILGRGASTVSASSPIQAATIAAICPAATSGATSATCSFTTTQAVAIGGTLVKQITAPVTATITATSGIPGCPTGAVGGNAVTYGPCTVAVAAGVTIQETWAFPAGTTSLTETITYNANGPQAQALPTVTTGTCQNTPLTGANTFACQNANSVAQVVSGGTLVFAVNCTTLPFCQYNVPGFQLPLSAGTCPLTSPLTQVGNGGIQNIVYTCGPGQTVPQGTVVTIPGQYCTSSTPPCVQAASPTSAPFEITTANANGPVGIAVPAPTQDIVTAAVGLAAANSQPTDENKFCNNTATNASLNQTLGGTSQTLSVSGPGKTFTLPLFSGASTCYIQLSRAAAAGGVLAPCDQAANKCADGNLILTLSTGSGAAISCSTGSLPAPQLVPPAGTPQSPNGGSCQTQVQNTQLNIPCGTTAGTAAASTTPSQTCDGVFFDIQSLLGACLNSPTSGLCTGFNGSNFAGTSATLTVVFVATPANGGTVGGIQLGTNTFTFSAPAVGLLLVSASPQLIPSNGTVASVVTATFACGSGATSINGFPLSAAGVTVPATFTTGSTTIVNQPIIGTGQNAVCGAGLAGSFNFTSPGPVLFDNGRSSESVNCGVSGGVSPFGVGAAPFGTPFGFAGNGINSTYPLVFTCTGAAVLAIGAGVAGDAPINVVYQGPLGLSAVGSTLITVSPSGIPRIAVSCNPSTIAAGSTGSICTATVTDINGTPLSGMTGATVTWTVSDPSNASILPCLVNVPGNLNITTYPNIAPQISPNTPCQVPTGQIPGQNTTFLNGQAAALLVASPTAHPETVTVTAALGVLIPPSFSCLVSPYLPGGYGTVTSPFTATSGVGLPGTTGCGFGNPVGFTGLATALSATTNGLGIGGVILPNTTSASTTVNIGGPAGILIAGATPTQPYALLRGCNQVIATTTPGTPIANIAALVSPASAVVSIWRFSNNTKQFQAGFFSDPNAPTDFNVTGGINAAPSNTTTGTQAGPGVAGNQVTETYFICVNQASTIVSG